MEELFYFQPIVQLVDDLLSKLQFCQVGKAAFYGPPLSAFPKWAFDRHFVLDFFSKLGKTVVEIFTLKKVMILVYRKL